LTALLDPTLANIESSSVTVGPAPFFVWGIHVAIPLGFVLFAGVRGLLARRRARMADARWCATAPLQPGPAVIHGKVELAPGSSTAVRVEIVQQGTEWNRKGNQLHEWREVARTVKAEPFYVHDRRGARIRVEPNHVTMLVDALDRTEKQGPNRRTRIAELSPGEEVYVMGTLVHAHDPGQGGYRNESAGLVLRAPAQGRMLCSTQPLGERFRKAAGWELFMASVFFVLLLIVSLVDIPYHLRVHTGVREDGEVLGVERVSGKYRRCALEIGMSNGETFSDAVPVQYCDVLGPGFRVPIVHVGSSWFAHVGTKPGVHTGAVVLPSILIGLAILGYVSGRPRPWYESKVVDAGTGRLK